MNGLLKFSKAVHTPTYIQFTYVYITYKYINMDWGMAYIFSVKLFKSIKSVANFTVELQKLM